MGLWVVGCGYGSWTRSELNLVSWGKKVIRNCLGLEMAGAYWCKRGIKFKASLTS